jgi:inorganic pyrophosphatase/exopolyphosphatase
MHRPAVPLERILLCAILFDTLNLKGLTTTVWDRLTEAVLSDISGVKNNFILASQQSKAKSKELAG